MKRKSLKLRKLFDRLLKIFSVAALALSVGVMLWICCSVCAKGGPALTWSFFTQPSKPYGVADGGIVNALFGSLLIVAGAALLAVPLGLAGGIFLAEFKEYGRFNAAVRFGANVLMGMPSVIVGLFVYMILVIPSGHFSGFAGSVALAIIMLPVIIRTTEDMLLMVPNALRESALALGMTRFRAVCCIVCRSARNGLLTGVLLALARVSGETAPLLFTALFADQYPTGYFNEPTANMPVLITEYATNSPFDSMHQLGWGAALVVMLVVLAINLGTRIIFREAKHDR